MLDEFREERSAKDHPVELTPLSPHDPPRLVAISYKGLSRLILQSAPRYVGRANIRIVNEVFHDAVSAAKALIEKNEVDVIISAGANAAYLRDRISIPVVRINVSGFDLLRALTQASRFSNKVALINYRENDSKLEEVKHLINVEIEQRSYTSIDDAIIQFRELKENGHSVVVGSSLVTELSQSEGLIGIMAYSEQGVDEAIDLAIEISRTRRIEQNQRASLNQIIQHLQEGIIAIDSQGNIQCHNISARRILGLENEHFGTRKLEEILPRLNFNKSLFNQLEPQQQVIRIGSRLVVATSVALKDYGSGGGAVFAFQDSASIERADRSIRTQRSAQEHTARYSLDDVMGESPAIRRAVKLACQYARSNSTVLITGESGTGKELFAQGIHNASSRRGGRFVAVNCAAFAESLLESELFGYEDGAFTGARKGGRVGLIESAHGGTLFLDEIGDMPISLQTRLLRVLQEREVTRVGGTLPTPVDVRIIAATNVDLRERMEEGKLREDLFYRLNILAIDVPPLRARGRDVSLIARRMLQRHLMQIQSNLDPQPLIDVIADRLEGLEWPGNVRQLENLMERLAVFYVDHGGGSSDLEQMVTECISDDILASPRKNFRGLKSEASAAEKREIERVLHECNGNMSDAARKLQISRSTLWRKLRHDPNRTPADSDR